MARRKRPSLVSEIARLFVEYPEKDWKALADRIRDRAFIEDLSAAIGEALVVVAESAEKTKKGRSRSDRSILLEVARKDKVKAAILSELKLRLTDKDEFVALEHVRAFASSLGMKEELSNRRDRAVNQIVRYLAGKETGEIETALQAALLRQAHQGQEFYRWVELILGRPLPQESEKGTPKTTDKGLYTRLPKAPRG